MNDIFKNMQVSVGCGYLSDFPSYKRKVWQEKYIYFLLWRFFGRMKNEMFYGRSWKDTTIKEFIR